MSARGVVEVSDTGVLTILFAFGYYYILKILYWVGLLLSIVYRVSPPLCFTERVLCDLGFKRGRFLLIVEMGTLSEIEDFVHRFLLPTHPSFHFLSIQRKSATTK